MFERERVRVREREREVCVFERERVCGEGGGREEEGSCASVFVCVSTCVPYR